MIQGITMLESPDTDQTRYLTTAGIDHCAENGKALSVDSIVKCVLHLDLKDIGERHLPEALGKNKVEHVDGPFVLQLQRVRNVSAPKDVQESHGAPRLLRLTLTDGHNVCAALELDQLPNLTLNTPPGTKVKLLGKVPVSNGFLLLDKHNCKILGGNVEKLVENWELKRSLAMHSRATSSQGGPPPFVPFGQRRKDEAPAKKDGKFRSLEEKAERSEDSEFEQQRQATIAKLQDVKHESKAKSYGSAGINKAQQDQDVAKIVDMGFSPDQANAALKQSGGNLQAAIDNLISGPLSRGFSSQNLSGRRDVLSGGFGRERGGFDDRRGRRGGDRGDRGGDRGDRGGDRGGRGGGKGPPERGGGGRGRRGRQDDAEEGDDGGSKPSAPATLFDFLTDKIPATNKKKGQGSTANVRDDRSETSLSTTSNEMDPKKNSTTTGGPQNLPPRFMKQQQQQRESVNWNPRGNHKQYDEYDKTNNPPSRGLSNRRHNQQSDESSRSSPHHSQQGHDHSYQQPRYPDNPHHNNPTRNDSRVKSQNPPHRDHQHNKGSGPSSYTKPPHQRDYEDGNPHGYRARQQYDNWGASQGTEYDNWGASQGTENSRSRGPNKNTGNRNPGPPIERDLRQPPGHAAEYRGLPSSNYASQIEYNSDTSYTGSTARSNGRQSGDSRPSDQSYSGEQRGQDTATSRWNMGDMCMALFKEDQQYYRAQITMVNGNSCSVFFVDYGNEELVTMSDIRPLQKQVWEASSDQASTMAPGVMLQPPPPMSFLMAFPSTPLDTYASPNVDYIIYQQPTFQIEQCYSDSPS